MRNAQIRFLAKRISRISLEVDQGKEFETAVFHVIKNYMKENEDPYPRDDVKRLSEQIKAMRVHENKIKKKLTNIVLSM